VAFAGDVGGVPARLALPAHFHAAMVRGHVGVPDSSWWLSGSVPLVTVYWLRRCRLSRWCVWALSFAPRRGARRFRFAETTKCAL
jgi:hypothetical protein